MDYCSVKPDEGGWSFSGMLIAKLTGASLGARYKILVNDKFETRSLTIEETEAGTVAVTKMESRSGLWLIDGKERTDLHGCIDADIEASPVTNTISIRRTRLKVGERVDLTAAWVRFPSLEVMPLGQSYERLG